MPDTFFQMPLAGFFSLVTMDSTFHASRFRAHPFQVELLLELLGTTPKKKASEKLHDGHIRLADATLYFTR